MLLYTLSRKFVDVKLAVEAMPITDNLSVAIIIADVAELVDALVLGTSANGVGVRVPSSAPMTYLFELTDKIKTAKKYEIFAVLIFINQLFLLFFLYYCYLVEYYIVFWLLH